MKFLRYVRPIALWTLLIIGVVAVVLDTWLFIRFLPMFGYDFTVPDTPLVVVVDWFFGINWIGVWPALILIVICINGLKRSQIVPVKAVQL